MTIKNIEQNFSQAERLAVKKFLKYVNDTAQTNSNFADASDIDTLNEFSDLGETDDDIKKTVREYLRLKKVRLRGTQTNN